MLHDTILFGVLQGIFEWLPISSQGNLVLLMVGVMGVNPQNALNLAIFLHTGTLLSVIVYFRNDIFQILRKLPAYKPGFDKENDSLITFLVISTIITGALGFVLYKTITGLVFSGEVFIALIGAALIIIGVLQKTTEKRKHEYRKLNLKDSIILGILQGFAVIPGISRSGVTVSAFLLRKYKPDDALRFSFLMSIPAVFAAEVGLVLMDSLPVITITDAIVGTISSFVVGLLTIHILLKVAKRVKFWAFCVFMGVLALIPFLSVTLGF